jgi:hypothetical protein
MEEEGFLAVACARWATVTRRLLRVYASDPLFWHRRMFWAKPREERLAIAAEELANGELRLQ